MTETIVGTPLSMKFQSPHVKNEKAQTAHQSGYIRKKRAR